jgi:hypothetical protein
MNQHEWVYGCYAYYLENGYEPGNPEDGAWEAAHWPVPKCKGGTKTILLLKEHHAVQGVLQSEEWQHPCVWGWEQNYLTGELLALCRLWMGQRGFNSYDAEERSRRAQLRSDNQTPEKRSKTARRAAASIPPEQRSSMARARRANQLANLTPEERSEIARKGNASRSSESKLKAKEGLLRARASKWRCTVTGFISNAGSLATWQRARGIDPANRERMA